MSTQQLYNLMHRHTLEASGGFSAPPLPASIRDGPCLPSELGGANGGVFAKPLLAGMPEMSWRLRVPVLAYGVLAGGILSGKYLDPERCEPDLPPSPRQTSPCAAANCRSPLALGSGVCDNRFCPRGPDKREGQAVMDNWLENHRTKVPEDHGYLSYGPATGRANLWPETYVTHR